MKKGLIVLCVLFMLSGCGFITNVNKSDIKNPEQVEVPSEGKKLSFEGHDLTLIDEGSFNSLLYKYPTAAYTTSIGTMSTVYYEDKEKQEYLFRIGITKFNGKRPEDVKMGDNMESLGTETINGNEWYKYLIDGKYHAYACYHDGDSYSIIIYTDYDLSEFESEFMKNISFR